LPLREPKAKEKIKMKFKRLGLAFCDGLKHEAAATAHILEKHGFEVVSVACKAGGIPRKR